MAQDHLSDIVEFDRFAADHHQRTADDTLKRSRALIRLCAHSIRAVYLRRSDRGRAKLLQQALDESTAMVEALDEQPALDHAGYTQDALKELVEAHLVYAVVRGGDWPTPSSLRVAELADLKGMSEAATEMRRFVLDLIRRGQVEEAEPYLNFMDDVYSLLITVDFPGRHHRSAS